MAAYQRIYALPDSVLMELRDKMMGHETVSECASWLQDSGHCTDCTLETLQRQLARFRREVVYEEILKPIEANLTGRKAVRTLGTLHTVAELEELAMLQKTRLMKVYDRELPMPDGILLETVSKEVQNYRQILESLAKLHLETGLLHRAPRTLSGHVGQNGEFSLTMDDRKEALFTEITNRMSEWASDEAEAEAEEILEIEALGSDTIS